MALNAANVKIEKEPYMNLIQQSILLAVRLARRYLKTRGTEIAAAALRLLVRLEQMTGFSAREALMLAA